jgi:5-methylthioadenosine/S-adenosylhomocysteine deaminase
MDAVLGDLPTADVHVRDGVIVAIGENLLAPGAATIDASNMIVMPGFVDGHRHMWEGLLRNALPTEDLSGYLQLVNQGFARVYTPDDAYLGTLVSALGALDAGITTVFDWSHIQTTPAHTAATIAALREAGLRAVFGFGMPGNPDRGHHWPEDLLRLQREEFASTDQLLTLALASLSPEHVPDEMAKAHFALARDAGLIISMHSGLNGMGTPGQIERFGNEGLLGPYVNLVHCNTLNQTEWRMVADTGTSVCLTPSVEMQMGHGVTPIQQAISAGVKPALGIDVETSIAGDMWTQMRALFGFQRQLAHSRRHAGENDARLLEVDDVLEYATVSGAVSARLEAKVGTLAVGKQADIILLRADLINVLPVNNMKAAVVLSMDPRNVDTVMVAGRVVKSDGKMLGVDMQQLSSRIYDRRDRVFEEANVPLMSSVRRL